MQNTVMPCQKHKQTRSLKSPEKRYIQLHLEMMKSLIALTGYLNKERKSLPFFHINSASLSKVTLSK